MVPRLLRTCFVLHFWADVLFAVPLFVAPEWFLSRWGWSEIDPATARLVAAALFGIGIQSLLGRDESLAAYLGMLNVKVIWSFFATVGLVWFQLTGGPPLGWIFAAIFAGFHLLWLYWRLRLGRVEASGRA